MENTLPVPSFETLGDEWTTGAFRSTSARIRRDGPCVRRDPVGWPRMTDRQRIPEHTIEHGRRRGRKRAARGLVGAREEPDAEGHDHDAEEDDQQYRALLGSLVARDVFFLEFEDTRREDRERDPALVGDSLVRLLPEPVLENELERLPIERMARDLSLEPSKKKRPFEVELIDAAFARIAALLGDGTRLAARETRLGIP